MTDEMCVCHGPARPHAPHHPCDKGCQPDWHRDDCAIYLPLPPAQEHRRVHNGEDTLDTCTGCDWESWDTAPPFEEHVLSPEEQA